MFQPVKRILLPGLLTVLFIILVVVTVEPDQLKTAFTRLDLGIIFQVFFLVFVNQLIRAIRFKLVLPKQLDFFFVLRVTCIHQFLNHILPMRTGEMSFPLLLGKYTDSTYSSSLASLVLVRLYDAIVLLGFILIALGFLVSQSRLDLSAIESSFVVLGSGGGLLLGLLLLVLFFFLYKKNSGASFFQANLSTYKVEKNSKNRFKLAGKASQWLSRFFKEFRLYREGMLHLKLFLLSVMIWVSLLYLFRIFLFSSGLVISWPGVVVGSGLASLTQLLPINTFGNIGTLEAGWVLGFSLLGLDSGQVLIAGISMHVLVIVASALYAILSWISLSYKSSR